VAEMWNRLKPKTRKFVAGLKDVIGRKLNRHNQAALGAAIEGW